MAEVIYFDNAATTYPKPECVVSAVEKAIREYGANPGRSGHTMAFKTAEMIYNTRKSVADMFAVDDPMNVVFTHNCTTALNYAIKGIVSKNSHCIISSLEHNAVIRPLAALKESGICDYSIADVYENDCNTVESFKRLIRPNTKVIICTGASNVFGKILPIEKISKLAHKYGIAFVVDYSQLVGIEKINFTDIDADVMCFAAHKGLYAPMSIGVMLLKDNINLKTLVEGGTGSYSASLTQPEAIPERFESGTLSVPLIAGLKAGVEFVKSTGTNEIRAHEKKIIRIIYSELKNMKNIILYTDPFSEVEHFSPILSFNVRNMNSEEVAQRLSDKNIAVRAGYHCAFSAHKAYHTQDTGTVRISPSFFTNNKDVNLLLNSVFEIAKNQ